MKEAYYSEQSSSIHDPKYGVDGIVSHPDEFAGISDYKFTSYFYYYAIDIDGVYTVNTVIMYLNPRCNGKLAKYSIIVMKLISFF